MSAASRRRLRPMPLYYYTLRTRRRIPTEPRLQEAALNSLVGTLLSCTTTPWFLCRLHRIHTEPRLQGAVLNSSVVAPLPLWGRRSCRLPLIRLQASHRNCCTQRNPARQVQTESWRADWEHPPQSRPPASAESLVITVDRTIDTNRFSLTDSCRARITDNAPNQSGDLLRGRIQGEMAGVKHPNFRAGHVPAVPPRLAAIE